jgi:hypothetical protein
VTHTVDLESFVVEGRFGPITFDARPDEVVEAIGEADHVEPQRRSTPMMMLYGDDVELRFYNNHLTAVSVGLRDDQPLDSGAIRTTGLWPPERRSMTVVRALLVAANVSWRVDEIMSRIYDEEDSQAWITEHHVHLGFFEGVLGRITLSDLDVERA